MIQEDVNEFMAKGADHIIGPHYSCPDTSPFVTNSRWIVLIFFSSRHLLLLLRAVTTVTGKPLKIDALRVAIKDHDLKVEAANAEAAAALLSMQNASSLSFNRVARRGTS